ncbi:uncharacterized protein THITE_2119603 [Thermothielavioides terrestris NRRL 8126]|uniref:Uncharacterized protein n=1 Tax=Thermothielavioides terrestris (strain ATCC 38088 / NRRL 8126) TaxID=578455 RepID=G2RC06_THETT|nr:uncharacterized protein THITE_2119603 [Thermothielavioides terrestris NRRL 8126]AEO69327.1 hypothetical protein THITE_2119603 [Thermothielavioides terrestris NRRL 8126]
MISQTLSGLVIRRSEAIPGVAHPKLPSISQLDLVPSPPPSPGRDQGDHCFQNHQLTMPTKDRAHVGGLSNISAPSPFPTCNDTKNSLGCGLRGSLLVHVEQRLPPISDLLRNIPPLLGPPMACPVSPPTALPSPVSSTSSMFAAGYPTWTSLPPRSQSVSGYYPGFMPPSPPPLGPRRASADCLLANTCSTFLSSRPSARHRSSPDRDRDRQRRHLKTVRRRHGGSPPSTSSASSTTTPTSFSSSFSHAAQLHPNNPLSSSQSHDSDSTTTPTTPNPPAPSPAPAGKEKAKAKEKEKRNNQPYTFEQEAFVIYHRVELDLPWDRVREAFMARWPAPDRSVSGLECAYYRTNGRLPATTPDGLLVLVDPEAEAAGMGREEKGFGGEGLGWAQRRKGVCERAGEGLVEEEEEEEEKNKGKEAAGDGGGGAGQYLYYRGVAYRTRAVKCRRAKISLMERFPEELVDERNDWVRHEHRVMARDIATEIMENRPYPFPSSLFHVFLSQVYYGLLPQEGLVAIRQLEAMETVCER